jgi:high-affinity nickel-transport protein
VLIGTMHGLAGSGALTLLVLTQIRSTWVGLLYLAIFGLGSIVGMLLMSGLIGLPFALTSKNLTTFHHRLQTVAALLSICFGMWYAYQTGSGAGLF